MVASSSINESLLNEDGPDVYEACLHNWAIEGHVGNRYYEMPEIVDSIETETEDLLKGLLNKKYANVQCASGSMANLVTYMGLLESGELAKGATVIAPTLECGGHLTHFSEFSSCTKHLPFKVLRYGLSASKGSPDNIFGLDYEQIEKCLSTTRERKLLICGFSSYPWAFNMVKLRDLCNKYNSLLMLDMSHIFGFCVSGLFKDSSKADIITSTCYKTMLGPKGGVISCDSSKIHRGIKKAIFPQTHGTLSWQMLLFKNLALKWCTTEMYRSRISQIQEITKMFTAELVNNGVTVIANNDNLTDTHMALIRCKNPKEISANLKSSGFLVNFNALYDDENFASPTGIRLGLTHAIQSGSVNHNNYKNVANKMAKIIIGKDKL